MKSRVVKLPMNNLQQQLEPVLANPEFELPLLPSVGAEVIALTQSDDTDAKALAQLIQRDVSLAGHVMRIANSAAYASRGQVQTLQQAIAKLGMRQISDMAVALSVGESVFTSAAAMQDILGYLWRHSLATAMWSREIARAARINSEVAFMCGLLHHVGKPVVVNQITLLGTNTSSQNEILEAVENCHHIVGVSLVEKWQMPNSVLDTVKFVHAYSATESNRQMVSAVSAASLLAENMLKASLESNIADDKIKHILGQELNFYQEDVEVLIGKADAVLGETEAMAL